LKGFAMDRSGLVLRYLRDLAAPMGAREQTDSELLSAYCAQQDQAAFAALVQRHGSLVMAVCGRVLPRVEDREDAFQATFLALARDAASVRKRESIASWLHGVARHIALDARRAASRRNKYEEQAMTTPAMNPAWEAAWREVQVVLDEEIQRLPEKYREPFVLCCLENQPRAEAASAGLNSPLSSGQLLWQPLPPGLTCRRPWPQPSHELPPRWHPAKLLRGLYRLTLCLWFEEYPKPCFRPRR
jgi:RNA polymerase sigma factor (sigma-70 family)